MKKKQRKYRLAILEDTTLREVFHFRVSAMSAITMLAVLFIVLLVSLSLLIVYTPIRNILPGYEASVRQQLIDESARVDSLLTKIEVQGQYLEVLRQISAGDIRLDSAQNLDSLQLMERAQIREFNNSEVTDAFMEHYEQQERERRMASDNAANRKIFHLTRPVRGTVVRSAAPDTKQYSALVRIARTENLLAIMRGTIIVVERMPDNTFTVVLQNGSFMAIYRHVPKCTKTQGATVDKGEQIGLMDADHDLEIEFWDDGQFVNPEEVIVW